MDLLAIETSGPILSVAVKKCGGKTRHATVKGFMKHAENLLPVIDRLLKKERLEIGAIDAFLIGRGPGSFTGIRIGFATLKGFLAVRPRPCYGASSLDVIAAGMPSAGRPELTVCLDARRGKLYTRSYRWDGKRWAPRGSAKVVTPAEASSRFSGKSRLAGDGILKLNTAGFEIASEKHWRPSAATLISLFEAKDPGLKELRTAEELLPLYLRRSEPEEKLKDQKKRS